ncbi:MAG: PD40 domain-containing protein, partial [Lewinella sp.]|nr:PD40 domain-containing protein [Lewinella sp.]
MKKALLHLTSLFLTVCLSAQSDTPLLRFPALSPDGSQLTFSYQGDIWTVARSGGPARRLTIHESYESHSRWSPDGQQIVFQSNRYGNDDVFLMGADGSRPQRLTFYSGGDSSPTWLGQDRLLFNSRRFFAAVERIGEIYSIPAGGGTPQRVLDALGDNPAASPDGRYIAFERGSCRVVREAYRGPANRDIWVYDTQSGNYTQISTDEGQDIYADWGPDNRLYFLSARNGRYNLYRTQLDTPSPEALTSFEDEGIRYFDVSADGRHIVIERGTSIYYLPASGGSPTPINIQLTGDWHFDPEENKTFSDDADEFALSPNGKYIAFSLRGELFVYPENKDLKRANRITATATREQDVAWVNDSTLIFISDRNGNRDLFLARAAAKDTADVYRAFRFTLRELTQSAEEEGHFVLSPDRKKVAFVRGRGQLLVADINPASGLSNQRTLLDGWDTPGGLSWSPDSKWLAYSMDDLNFNSEIYIHPVDQSRDPVNVSLHPRRDFSPVWSEDGSKLAFLSDRNNGNSDVWFVWLKASDWEKTQRDWEEDELTIEDTSDKKTNEDQAAPKSIRIDFEDIHERLVQVSALPGNEHNLVLSPDGETFYYSTNGSGRQGQSGDQAFMSVKWDGTDSKTIYEDRSLSSLAWDKKGKNLYFLERGRINKLTPENKKTESLAFQARMKIDHVAERKEVFEDAWRALRDGFYDPNFHGQDWNALRTKYEPRALAASTAQDFRDMFNEMLGQLNASHMGLYGSNPEETQKEVSGLLGVETVPVENGVEIRMVIPDSPADRASSRLQVGEIITAVNDVPVRNGENYYALLNGTANERTLLNVRSAKGN